MCWCCCVGLSYVVLRLGILLAALTAACLFAHAFDAPISRSLPDLLLTPVCIGFALCELLKLVGRKGRPPANEMIFVRDSTIVLGRAEPAGAQGFHHFSERIVRQHGGRWASCLGFSSIFL